MTGKGTSCPKAARFLDEAELHPAADAELRRLLAAAEAKIADALALLGNGCESH